MDSSAYESAVSPIQDFVSAFSHSCPWAYRVYVLIAPAPDFASWLDKLRGDEICPISSY